MAAMTGLGVLVMALFPLSLPFLILLAAATAPLLLLGAAVAVPLAAVALLALGVRAIVRRIGRARGTPSAGVGISPQPIRGSAASRTPSSTTDIGARSRFDRGHDRSQQPAGMQRP